MGIGAAATVKGGLHNGQMPISDALVGSRTSHSPAQGSETPSNSTAASKGTAGEQPNRGSSGADVRGVLAPEQPQTPAMPDVVKAMPVIIRYKLPGSLAKGEKPPKKDIKLLLEANQWRPMPMSPSDDNYFAVVNLQPGEHCFKFEVDGEVVLDASQPVRSAGEPANTVTVTEALLFSHLDDVDLINDVDGWGQTHTEFEETRKHPPIMPPHLRYTPLNTPPTQIRCDVDGNMAPTGAVPLDPEHLPLPLSVTINHAYFQRRDDHVVLGVTTRYRNKFTTVTYYKKE